jgi:hypothetical protein
LHGFDDPGEAGSPKRTPSRVGHRADDLCTETGGNSLNVLGHVFTSVSCLSVAAAVEIPATGIRFPGNRRQ